MRLVFFLGLPHVHIQRSARIESERAKQSFEIQQEAELTLSQKFKGIVSDLRRSWEEEETGRAMQLEERLRSHYSVVRNAPSYLCPLVLYCIVWSGLFIR